MDLTPPIIFFIGFCLFILSHAEPETIPDAGRLKTGECFGKGLGWKLDFYIELQDHLFQFCAETLAKTTHIQDKIRSNELDAEKVYTTIAECLNESNLHLIDRYKSHLPDQLKDKVTDPNFPEINQVAVGFCQEKEVIEYKKLSKEDKLTTAQCLQNCAEGLFKKFERIFNDLQSNYENPATPPGKEPQTRKLPEELELTVNVDQFKDRCDAIVITELTSLNILEEEFAATYITKLDKLYEKSPIEKKKNQVFESAESYYACARWPCAIADVSDVPLSNAIENIIAKKSKDSNDLIID